jgi:hypothetical protein
MSFVLPDDLPASPVDPICCFRVIRNYSASGRRNPRAEYRKLRLEGLLMSWRVCWTHSGPYLTAVKETQPIVINRRLRALTARFDP